MTLPKKFVLTGLAWSVALLIASPILLTILTAFKTDAAADLGPFAPFIPTLANFASHNPNVEMLRPVLNNLVEAAAPFCASSSRCRPPTGSRSMRAGDGTPSCSGC